MNVGLREVIRDAMTQQGRSLYWLATESGVSYSRVHAFLVGGTTITSDNLERLLGALSLRLAPAPRRK